MSHALTPQDALRLMQDWNPDDYELSVLEGGLTNRNFHVRRSEEQYVLRMDAEHTAAFRLDRKREFSVMRSAAEAGLAPPVLCGDPDSGILLRHYVPGRTWGAADLEVPENLEALAALLQCVHDLPLCGSVMDAPSIAAAYIDNLRAQDGLRSFAAECFAIIADDEKGTERRLCHNDVVAANILATPQLMLLDWEYASDNDPLFDIASLVAYHDLSTEQAQTLLIAYSGDNGQWQRFEQQRRRYDALQWLWLASRQTITGNDEQRARLGVLRQRLRHS